jgi:phenylacetic acid degradation operon negative regulatory protein
MRDKRATGAEAPDALAAAAQALIAAEGVPPVWSLIVTVFGDMVLPRGGALSTASLIRLLEAVGVTPASVRTALSRLVADGWLESERHGRRSVHRMRADAIRETEAASMRIYRAPAETASGRFDLAFLAAGTPAERQGARALLLAQGFAALQPDVLVRPVEASAGDPLPLAGVHLFRQAEPTGLSPEALVAAAYDMPAILARRERFLTRFGPLLDAAQAPAPPASAAVARLLLIHGYRRLALRDPRLPAALMPDGRAASRPYARVAAAYRQLFASSERWLDDHAEGAEGPLPPPSSPRDRHGRFAALGDEIV